MMSTARSFGRHPVPDPVEVVRPALTSGSRRSIRQRRRSCPSQPRRCEGVLRNGTQSFAFPFETRARCPRKPAELVAELATPRESSGAAAGAGEPRGKPRAEAEGCQSKEHRGVSFLGDPPKKVVFGLVFLHNTKRGALKKDTPTWPSFCLSRWLQVCESRLKEAYYGEVMQARLLLHSIHTELWDRSTCAQSRTTTTASPGLGHGRVSSSAWSLTNFVSTLAPVGQRQV